MFRDKRRIVYTRLNRHYGRHLPLQRVDQILFQHDRDKLNRTRSTGTLIKPKELVSRAAGTTKRYGRQKIPALYAQQKCSTVFHKEGGWTKDIDPTNATETQRYIRKLEKSEDINATIEKWRNIINDRVTTQEMAPLEYMIDHSTTFPLESEYHGAVVATYEDPSKIKRPLRDLCWLGPGHIVGAYARGHYYQGRKPSQFYIWDVENSIRPLETFSPSSGVLCIACHPRNTQVLLTGHLNGELCMWDLRQGHEPVEVFGGSHYVEIDPKSIEPPVIEPPAPPPTPIKNTHYNTKKLIMMVNMKESLRVIDKKPVYCTGGKIQGNNADVPVTVVTWMSSGEYEVVAGDIDGRIRRWDTRYFSQPMDTVNIVMPSKYARRNMPLRAPGITALEIYPKNRNKFMVGTDSGHIMYGNWNTKDPNINRIKMHWKCPVYGGPVKCLERSDVCPDVVLAAGASKLRFFSDHLKFNNITSLAATSDLYTWATWCPTNGSLVYSTRQDGTVEMWNMLTNMDKPTYRLKACDESIMVARCRLEGDILAIGCCNGTLRLVRYSENLYSLGECDNERLVDLFNRELASTQLIKDRMSLPCLQNLGATLPIEITKQGIKPPQKRPCKFVTKKETCKGNTKKAGYPTKRRQKRNFASQKDTTSRLKKKRTHAKDALDHKLYKHSVGEKIKFPCKKVKATTALHGKDNFDSQASSIEENKSDHSSDSESLSETEPCKNLPIPKRYVKQKNSTEFSDPLLRYTVPCEYPEEINLNSAPTDLQPSPKKDGSLKSLDIKKADLEDTIGLQPSPEKDDSLESLDIKEADFKDTIGIQPSPEKDDSLESLDIKEADLKETIGIQPSPEKDDSLESLDIEEADFKETPSSSDTESDDFENLEDVRKLNTYADAILKSMEGKQRRRDKSSGRFRCICKEFEASDLVKEVQLECAENLKQHRKFMQNKFASFYRKSTLSQDSSVLDTTEEKELKVITPRRGKKGGRYQKTGKNRKNSKKRPRTLFKKSSHRPRTLSKRRSSRRNKNSGTPKTALKTVNKQNKTTKRLEKFKSPSKSLSTRKSKSWSKPRSKAFRRSKASRNRSLSPATQDKATLTDRDSDYDPWTD